MCLKIHDWPAVDQHLWRNATDANHLFDSPSVLWRPTTLRGCERGWGVFLKWLVDRGYLNPDDEPNRRVTMARLVEFTMQYETGRSELSVASTVRDVAYFLRAIYPPDGLSWLTRQAHRRMNAAIPSRPKLPRLARVSAIADAADAAMSEGWHRLALGQRSGAVMYRDGLMIALLIRRPMRRKNVSGLRLGQTIIVEPTVARIRVPSDETKTRAGFEYRFPNDLFPALMQYIEHVRPVLLRGSEDEVGWLWIGRRGQRLTEQDITVRVSATTALRCGRRISPHLFRDCAATEIAIEDPLHVGITRSMLGHSSTASSERFYNQAGSFSAVERMRDVLNAKRVVALGQAGLGLMPFGAQPSRSEE